jgi:uncharacterized membrane protein
MTGRRSPLALAALLIGMGLLHLAVPKPFARLVPGFLGPARFWVAVSGVAEIASGAALLRPSTRRAGAWAAAATLVAVFPGNVKMALDAGPPDSAWSTALWLRLPLQIPLVVWAIRCARPVSLDPPGPGTRPGSGHRP